VVVKESANLTKILNCQNQIYISYSTAFNMDVDRIMKKFTTLMYEAKLDQARLLIKKYSRNKGNELAEKLFYLGFLHGSMQIHNPAIFCLDLSMKISRDVRLKEKARKYLVAPLNLRANLLTKTGLFHEAEIDYRKAVSLSRDLSQTHNNYAILLRKMERFKEARDQYEIALEKKPDDHEVHHNFAILLARMGDLERAEEHLEGPLKAGYFPAQLTYSSVLIARSKYKEAEDLLYTVLRTHPEEPRILANLGIVLFAQGILDESMKYFLRAKVNFAKESSMKNIVAVEGLIDWINATKAWAACDVNTSSQLFKSASEKLHQGGFEAQSLATNLLSLLIPFDRDVAALMESKSLQELKASVQSLYQEMNVFLNVESPKLPHFQILSCKFKYIEVLHHVLFFKDYDIEELERSKRVLRQFDFSGDLQLLNSMDNFLQELRHYRSLEEIPSVEEEKLLRMIQPFYKLNELITGELSKRTQGAFLEERMDSMEKTLLQKMDEIVEEVQYSRDLIIVTCNAKYAELIDHFTRLNNQQLQEFQRLVEMTIQSEIDKIGDNKRKGEAVTRWNQLRKLASVTRDIVGFIASVIQIYLFIKDGGADLAFNQVEILLRSSLIKIVQTGEE
jgi:Flp pilus assembly protein TadD